MEKITKETNNEIPLENFEKDIDIIFSIFISPKESYDAVRKYILDMFTDEKGELIENEKVLESVPYIREKVKTIFDDVQVSAKFDYLLLHLNTAFEYDKANLNKEGKNWQ